MATVGQLTADKKALDPRTIVENEEAIYNITQAYVGLIIYNKENGKLYKVTEINPLSGKIINKVILPPSSIGAQPEINSSNKLSADSIVDGVTNKVVTQTEKDNWNNKVNAESGKGLSTNDYNNIEKAKVANAIQTPTVDENDKIPVMRNGSIEWEAKPSNGQDGAQGPQGVPGHNPCLGRLNVVPADFAIVFPDAIAGDYVYVDIYDSTTQTTTTTIYHYVDDTNGWDSGTVIDAEHPTFASSQPVTAVHIKDENGDDDPDAQGVLSADAGKLIVETTMEKIKGFNILNPDDIEVGKKVSVSGSKTDIGDTLSNYIYGCTKPIKLTSQGLVINHGVRIPSTVSSVISGAVIFSDNNGEPGSVVSYPSANPIGSALVIDPTDHPTWQWVVFNLPLYDAAGQNPISYTERENDGYAIYRAKQLPTTAYQEYVPPYYVAKSAEDGSITTQKLADSSVTTSKISDGAVTSSKISDGAIGLSKTDFSETIIGKNLFNKNAEPQTGTYNYTDGTINPASGLLYSYPLISVESGETYHYSRSNDASASGIYGSVAFFNNGTFVSAIRNNTETGGVKTFTVPQGVNQVGLSVWKDSVNDDVQLEKGSSRTTYEAYSEKRVIKQEALPNVPTIENVIDALPDNNYYPDTLELSLPNEIIAVQGDTIQVFYQGIVVCPNIELYDITVECSVGKGLYRYYEYAVPSNATPRSVNWTINVRDANGNLLASKTCDLVITAKPSSPASNVNILCVGDSLSLNGIWVSEWKRRMTANNGTPTGLNLSNISFIGSKTKTPEGLVSVNLECNSGWAWTDYDDEGRPRYRFTLDGIYNVHENDVYTNNSKSYTIIEINNESGSTVILTSTASYGNTTSGTTLTKTSGNDASPLTLTFTAAAEETGNPFWNGNSNKLDFVNYVEHVCGLSSGTKIDYVYFLMTWNELNAGWDTIIGQIKTILDALHSDYPDCKVRLMAVQFIDVPTFRAASSNENRMSYIRRIAEMNEKYAELARSSETSGTSEDSYSSFVEFVNVATQFDSKYNMTRSNVDVNTRNSSIKEVYTYNSIHPGTSGYLQIADVAYRYFCKDLNE